ncbi:hypothetical protein [Actinoplanes sp. URMC 104]|uniref:hypothetical protein n=1 Tax=Actinoplanes sp. URMC 104 TaxID=3423409 RepID=UPI003F1B963F
MTIATAAPATTTDTTAVVEIDATGTALLRVVVDGELVAFEFDVKRLVLRNTNPADEATRLLKRHAGYTVGSAWNTDERGRMTATVAEISGRCPTCAHGCGCAVDEPGCGHYMCLAAPAELRNTCQGAVIALDAKRPPLRGQRYARPNNGSAKKTTAPRTRRTTRDAAKR